LYNNFLYFEGCGAEFAGFQCTGRLGKPEPKWKNAYLKREERSFGGFQCTGRFGKPEPKWKKAYLKREERSFGDLGCTGLHQGASNCTVLHESPFNYSP
jgi:hypothetical protein